MPLSAREIFARIIRCEAEGEGDNGMKAVATVVMNRVHIPYGEYQRVCQGDLRRVIMQPDQFTCVKEIVAGQYNPQNIYNMTPLQVHYDIADWALSGNKSLAVNDCLWYYNPFSPDCAVYFPVNRSGVYHNRVAQHCFYTPTQYYAQT
ncbi:MAG TPA: cell wall hydrolase [Clostridiaceae bacterium]|jgi:N-acetylmuramoyl-L-alanine amidase|nr:cell wall hydrolase [Clostridiaceae bacterium]